MRPLVVVVFLEIVQRGLQFRAAIEIFAREKFVAELAEKALDVAVLPLFPRLTYFLLHDNLQTAEFRAVVAHEALRPAVHKKQPFEFFLHLEGGKAWSCFQQQVFPCEAIEHAENARLAAILEPVVSEIQAPGLIRRAEKWLWRSSDAKSLASSAPDAQALVLPDTMHRFNVDARQPRVHAAKTVPRVGRGERHNFLSQFWISLFRHVTRSMLGKPRHPASADARTPASEQVIHRAAPRDGAHHFPFCNSLYASISSAMFATMRLSLRFSSWSALNSASSLALIPA